VKQQRLKISENNKVKKRTGGTLHDQEFPTEAHKGR